MAESTFLKPMKMTLPRGGQEYHGFLQDNGLRIINRSMVGVDSWEPSYRRNSDDESAFLQNKITAVDEQYNRPGWKEIFGNPQHNMDCAKDITCKFRRLSIARKNASSTWLPQGTAPVSLNLGEQHPTTCGAKANLSGCFKNNSNSAAGKSWAGGKTSSSFRNNQHSLFNRGISILHYLFSRTLTTVVNLSK
jgi:hypothetical protein